MSKGSKKLFRQWLLITVGAVVLCVIFYSVKSLLGSTGLRPPPRDQGEKAKVVLESNKNSESRISKLPLPDRMLEQYRSELNRTTDPFMRSSLERKIDVLERDKSIRESLAREPKDPSRSGLPFPPPSVPPPPREVGIVPLPDITPFGPTILNMWRAQIDTQWLQVYAGSLPENSEQGIVIVELDPLDPKDGPANIEGQYKTPAQSGPVKIVAANGPLLTLEAENGDQFVFNAATQKFVSP